MTNETHRPIDWYTWAGDAKHILYLQDNAGDEINHLFSADLTNDKVRDLTPFPGVRAQNVLTDLQHPKFVLVALNRRDRAGLRHVSRRSRNGRGHARGDESGRRPYMDDGQRFCHPRGDGLRWEEREHASIVGCATRSTNHGAIWL